MSGEDVKHLTCSMTRANKILTSLRETYAPKKKDKYRYISDEFNENYGFNVSLINYSEEDITRKLDEIKEKHHYETVKRRLIAKLKNRLFTLNVRYNINDIISEIDVLRAERQKLYNIIENINRNSYLTLDKVKLNMEIVKQTDKKFDFEWNVGAFDVTELKKQIKTLTKQIGALDDKRDQANIQNSFTIELTSEEYTMLDLE